MKRAETQVSPRVSPPVTLAVTEYGDRSSSTHVLMVHGFPDDQQMWEPVVRSLPEVWHVVTYDVRGAGRSTKPTGRAAYRTELLVEDLIAVLDATVPVGEQVHLVGHDWGAIALWEVIGAETWDPRLEGRLASYTSSSGPSLDHMGSLSSSWRGRLQLMPQLLHSWYVWLTLAPVLPELVWRCNRLFGPVLRLLDPTMSHLAWGKQVSANARHSVNLYRANILQHLRSPVAWRTSVPVQLVVANRDPWVTPRAVAGMEARCRRLSRVEVDEGHWLPRARPVEFAELVAGFVRRHGEPIRLQAPNTLGCR